MNNNGREKCKISISTKNVYKQVHVRAAVFPRCQTHDPSTARPSSDIYQLQTSR